VGKVWERRLPGRAADAVVAVQLAEVRVDQILLIQGVAVGIVAVLQVLDGGAAQRPFLLDHPPELVQADVFAAADAGPTPEPGNAESDPGAKPVGRPRNA
jgi:hypothetical protein